MQRLVITFRYLTNSKILTSRRFFNQSSAFATATTLDSSECKNMKRQRLSAVVPVTNKISYEDAITTLNRLQSNASTIKKSILNSPHSKAQSLTNMKKYLERTGITLKDLDKLSFIHVSGTKGKGSTCALTESILRSFGIRTGFYNSPHLISVTERIRINGQPISETSFVEMFSKIYQMLAEKKETDLDMPSYFLFLTILCFHIFLVEKVDVAIIEVGIGGQYDCTNIIRNTKTVGITSLGLEHVNLLGNTLGEIAWQKAGIIKPKSNVFTVNQPAECMKVLRERAAEKNATLYVVPDFTEYNWKKKPKLQIENKAQILNASLAIQLSYDWLRKNDSSQLIDFPMTLKVPNGLPLDILENLNDGLEQCFWPGRCQLVEYKNLRIYLDGAHTVESVQICIDWFQKQTENSCSPKFLIFNTTGDRDSTKLIDVLNNKMKFTHGCFVPNIPFSVGPLKIPDISSIYSNTEQIERAESHYNYWQTLSNNGSYYDSIVDALYFICKDGKSADILVTGSLHLIGATILAIDEHDKQNSYNNN